MARRSRTPAFAQSYNTVSQPGTSLATGFFSGLNSNMEADRKVQALLAPKMMEIQSRYGIEQMKQGYKGSEAQDKKTENDKRDLQKQLRQIQQFYKNKKISIQEKMADASDDVDLFSKNKGDNPKVQKLKELYSQVEESEQNDTKDILDQLKQYYQK